MDHVYLTRFFLRVFAHFRSIFSSVGHASSTCRLISVNKSKGHAKAGEKQDTPVAKPRSRSRFREAYRPRQQVVIFGIIRR
ncbi:hypothetical protein PanWU01x14_213560 [Parasponia andersonii]|uniref:Uncharacterized protein n=1 Tax=Parasponia andersonii TaxID=3476 RepID=A0A2P5BSL5_PARAD|nr:hypothetical protein PanWU01x14_213560 [Parasponia andersonii]